MRYDLGRFRRPMRRSTETQLLSLIGLGDGSTLSLDFTAMSTLDPRFTFTRNSLATFINSQGLIQEVTAAATNDPTKARFDYDPTTFAPRGLLIEGSVTNLLTWSESFATSGGTSNWNWSALNVTRGTSTQTDPKGVSSTVIKIEETSATGFHAPLIVPAASSSTTYTVSVFAKAAERSYVQLFDNGGSSANAMVNLSNGAVVSESLAGITTVTALGTTGWYRISMRLTTGAGQLSINFQLRLSTNGTTTSYAGTTGSGIYIWGAQLEQSAGATSYIPTGAGTVQRAADDLQLTGANFSSIWPSGLSEWSVYWSGDIIRAPATTQFVWLARAVGSSRTRGFVTTGSSIRSSNNIADLTPGLNATVNTVFKMATGFKNADCFMWAHNGATTASAAETSSGLQTDSDRLLFNVNADNFMHIRQFKFWQSRLSNGTLQGLVS